VAFCAGRGTRRVAKRIVGDVGEEGKRAVRGSASSDEGMAKRS